MTKKNDIFEAVIEDITLEGSGVCRKDGFAFFVPQTAPGDRIKVKAVKILKNYGFGIVEELLEPSPWRAVSDCPVFRQCGGCCFRHISYQAETALKEKAVTDAFQRIGGFSQRSLPILAAQQIDFYRNKAQFPLGYDKDGKPTAGFFAARSHRIIPAKECRLQDAAFRPIVSAILQWIEKYHIPIYQEKEKTGLLRHIFLRSGFSSGEIMVCLVSTNRKVPYLDALKRKMETFPHVKSLLLNINSRDTNVILGKDTLVLSGKEEIQDRLLGVDFSIGPLSFYQVNPRQTEKLYSLAYEFAGFTGKESLLDLYCGIGSIGLCAYPMVKDVTGVEIVPQAIENARKNAKNNGMKNTRFFCGDAKEAALAFVKEGYRPDVLIVDPPRKGCDPEVIRAIGNIGPEKVVMISCNPATAARDCKLLCENGYQLQKFQAVDMFPRTAHVETVVLLSRETNPLTVEVRMEVETGEVKEHPTYKRIQEYVQEKYGFKVHTAYIAEVKRMVGLDMHKAPNAVEQRKHEYHPCPPEKVEAIKDALRHFGLISE